MEPTSFSCLQPIIAHLNMASIRTVHTVNFNEFNLYDMSYPITKNGDKLKATYAFSSRAPIDHRHHTKLNQ